jgi:hypothetical protein
MAEEINGHKPGTTVNAWKASLAGAKKRAGREFVRVMLLGEAKRQAPVLPGVSPSLCQPAVYLSAYGLKPRAESRPAPSASGQTAISVDLTLLAEVEDVQTAGPEGYRVRPGVLTGFNPGKSPSPR